MEIKNLICFDLEGPLSPQDNAFELMKLIPEGGRIFEVISRYDDLLTLEEKEDYEPGDTLALIVPFLVLHHIGFLFGLLKGKETEECGQLGDMVARFSITGVGARACLPTSSELSRRYRELYQREL